jgi:hypothetical protein
LGFLCLDHPPYSPDLALSDYHLFPGLKKTTESYREQSKLSTDIYRKPTFTDMIIPNDSCHPKEHKVTAIRYLYNRMNSYQLSSDNMQKENNTIIQILTSNKYDAPILNTMNNRKVKTNMKEKESG